MKKLIVIIICLMCSGCAFSQTYRVETNYNYPVDTAGVKCVMEFKSK